MNLPRDIQVRLDRTVDLLQKLLGENLHSCILYGSAVRGDFVPAVSDLNFLMVLNESTAEAHAAIADAVRGTLRIEPFVLGRKGLERSMRSFALKFRSPLALSVQ